MIEIMELPKERQGPFVLFLDMAKAAFTGSKNDDVSMDLFGEVVKALMSVYRERTGHPMSVVTTWHGTQEERRAGRQSSPAGSISILGFHRLGISLTKKGANVLKAEVTKGNYTRVGAVTSWQIVRDGRALRPAGLANNSDELAEVVTALGKLELAEDFLVRRPGGRAKDKPEVRTFEALVSDSGGYTLGPDEINTAWAQFRERLEPETDTRRRRVRSDAGEQIIFRPKRTDQIRSAA